MTTQRASSRTQPKTRAAPPAEVVPGIFVGGWDDPKKFKGSRFCVLDERPDELGELPGPDKVTIYCGAKDGPILPHLERVADLINKAREEGSPVLAFCGHGLRSTPLGAACYVHRFAGMRLEEVSDRLKSVRLQVERPKQRMAGWRDREGYSSGKRVRGNGHA